MFMAELLKIASTPISGVLVVESDAILDHRGSFARFYCEQALASVIGERRIVQINHSCTRDVGTVRGLHYQNPPHAEMKFVRCFRGRVWDVAVDLRAGSPTFLSWHAEELSPENSRMLVIPEGCAHGFQALEEESELLYLHTACYYPPAEGGLQPVDPELSIKWPLSVVHLSERDRNYPLLSADLPGLSI